MTSIFYFLILIFSIVIHEVSHGYMAKSQGDDTAESMGRLTLNPLYHIDPIGSVLLPLVLYISTQGSFVFGWAKPVPIDPRKFKNQRWGELLVSLAGPFSNLCIALCVGLGFRFGVPFLQNELGLFIVTENVLLAIFNLVPIPPLDGSKVLFGLLPASWRGIEYFMTQYGMVLFLLFVFLGFQTIMPIVEVVVRLFIGA